MIKWLTFLSCTLIINMASVYSQDTITNKKKITPDNSKSSVAPSNNMYRSSQKEITNLRNVEQAITDNDEDKKYEEYILIADKLSQEKKYEESNSYLNKSLAYYQKTKDKKKQSQIHRKIALNNEKLKDLQSAYDGYKKAQDLSTDKVSEEIISNDIKRVQGPQTPSVKEQTLERNIEVLQVQNNTSELTDAYKYLADAALENKDTQKAIDALIQSKNTSTDKEDKIKVQEQLADIYASKDSIGFAITLLKDAQKLSLESYDWENYINQSIKLSSFYLQASNKDSAEYILKNALSIAYKSKNTQAILILTKELKDFYHQTNQSNHADQYIDSLLLNLWNIATNDTLIYQDAILNEVQERISLLEKDKENQHLNYERTKRYNTILLIILICLLFAIGFVIYALLKLRKKNYLILLQSLRREMNPHFIFNALNSINLFIAKNDELAANKFLTRYSSLMRTNMTSSNKNFISLEEEILILKDYVALEHMRFEDHFDYEFIIDEKLQEDHYFVPNMILQPFIENAVWHGLRYKDEKGKLVIHFTSEGDSIKVLISDNGIGVEKSKSIKSKNQKHHKSIGIHNTLERIDILNRLFHANIQYATSYLDVHNKTGHCVMISWNKKFNTYENE